MNRPNKTTQRRLTGWQLKYDGLVTTRAAGNLTQKDVDSLSLQLRRKSATVVDGGRIRGEVAEAIIEARRWAEV